MGHKKSRYNVEIDRLDDGGILIYNTYSGIFGIMDVKTQAMYNDIENIDVASVEDASSKENLETLIQCGYIVDHQLDELARFKLERADSRLRSNTLGLTIAPTMACNMRCPYCYESKNGKTMSKDIQEKVVQFVKKHFSAYPNIEKMHVTWYGGEPLLQKKTIYELSEAFLQICQEENISYDATIITNGTLLDRETAWRLHHDCHVRRAQITIDGMPQTHNQRRILADGSDSFGIIMQNIEECRSFMNIIIRMNIDRSNEAEIEKFLQFTIEEKKWGNNPSIYVAPVDSYTENCAHLASTCYARSEFSKIQNDFQNMNYAIDRRRVTHNFFPNRRYVNCGAEWKNSYVIDPEGYYYTCWMVIGDKTQQCGHVDKPFVLNSEHYKWLSSELPRKCEECEYLPMCAGGCGYFRIVKEGEPNCTGNYYSYKETLRLAYQDYMRQKAQNNK